MEKEEKIKIAMQEFRDLQTAVHSNAKFKGFWESENIAEKLALVHSEVSEALEGYRKDKNDNNMGEEMADIVIRCMDICGYLKIDLIDEIVAKFKKNLDRPYKHGKEF